MFLLILQIAEQKSTILLYREAYTKIMKKDNDVLHFYMYV